MTTSPGRATAQRALTEAAMERTTIRSYRRFLRESAEAGSTWQAWADHTNRMTELFLRKFPTADPLDVAASFTFSQIPESVLLELEAGTKLVPRKATGLLPVGQEDMMRLLRTATTQTHGATSMQALAGDGYQSKRWIAHHDNVVRPSHLAASGQTVPISANFQVGSSTLMYPGDPTAPPHERENCRCVIVGVA
jgi:hypothetical protein